MIRAPKNRSKQGSQSHSISSSDSPPIQTTTFTFPSDSVTETSNQRGCHFACGSKRSPSPESRDSTKRGWGDLLSSQSSSAEKFPPLTTTTSPDRVDITVPLPIPRDRLSNIARTAIVRMCGERHALATSAPTTKPPAAPSATNQQFTTRPPLLAIR